MSAHRHPRADRSTRSRRTRMVAAPARGAARARGASSASRVFASRRRRLRRRHTPRAPRKPLSRPLGPVWTTLRKQCMRTMMTNSNTKMGDLPQRKAASLKACDLVISRKLIFALAVAERCNVYFFLRYVGTLCCRSWAASFYTFSLWNPNLVS